ncbi:hypothetical protein [Streptomyces sp. NPDC055794]
MREVRDTPGIPEASDAGGIGEAEWNGHVHLRHAPHREGRGFIRRERELLVGSDVTNHHLRQPDAPVPGVLIDHASVQYMAGLLERLLDEHGGDEAAAEVAFHDVVRGAWVREEAWAVEYVAASQEVDGRSASLLLGILEDIVEVQRHTDTDC